MSRRRFMGQYKWEDVEMPVMRSESQDGWICSESSRLITTSVSDQRESSSFWRAFDGIIIQDYNQISSLAHTDNYDQSPYWELTCPYPVCLYGIKWYYRSLSIYETDTIYIEGSNGQEWILLDTLYMKRQSLIETYDISNKYKYLKYRIRGKSSYLIATELKLYIKR